VRINSLYVTKVAQGGGGQLFIGVRERMCRIYVAYVCMVIFTRIYVAYVCLVVFTRIYVALRDLDSKYNQNIRSVREKGGKA